MGIFDEFKRLAHPYEDEDEDDYDDFDISPRPVERRERGADRVSRDSGYSSYNSAPIPEDDRRSNKVVNIRAATQLQVVLVKPERFEDASSIADHLRE
ncbi:MAG: cell division protein SepF, partial [Lawsonibacter sp.]|nr:cell division protein SepF [Lawsonibacter sp.]